MKSDHIMLVAKQKELERESCTFQGCDSCCEPHSSCICQRDASEGLCKHCNFSIYLQKGGILPLQMLSLRTTLADKAEIAVQFFAQQSDSKDDSQDDLSEKSDLERKINVGWPLSFRRTAC